MPEKTTLTSLIGQTALLKNMLGLKKFMAEVEDSGKIQNGV
jgi:hypothetical protein